MCSPDLPVHLTRITLRRQGPVFSDGLIEKIVGQTYSPSSVQEVSGKRLSL